MEKVVFGRLKEQDYGMTEAMRSLRTNISFCGDDIQTILLTSTMPDEGKSTIALNLARALAENNKKVLLLDADIRKSVMIGYNGIQKVGWGTIYGLSHYLTGQRKLDEVIYETNIENLYLIVSGPVVPNPTEILGNHYFGKMLQTLKSEYDMIIIDGAPIGSVIDSAVIAPKCDGAILVIEQGRASKRFIKNTKKQLEVSGVRILGVVLNKVKRHASGYYKEYYKEYYRESENQEEGKDK